MANSTQYKRHSETLRQLLLIKGYRSQFRGSVNQQPENIGALDAVLRLLESKLQPGVATGSELTLITIVPNTQIEVKLIGRYDPVKGFSVHQQHISHNAQRPEILHMRVNQEILGASAVLARNPRPRTRYEELLKGRPFRRSK